MIKRFSKIAITTGDSDGIGTEIASKALYNLRPKRGVQFYLWRSANTTKRDLRKIDRYFKRKTVSSWPEALRTPPDFYKTLIDIESPLPPAQWVELMAKAGMSKSIDALVTAPLSKTEIINSGFKDNGHTDILKRISKTKDVYMCFLGNDFNVTLLTGHLSIKKAYDRITEDNLKKCIQLTKKMAQKLPTNKKLKPIALVGCNPHAGEQGVIDSKEQNLYSPLIKKLNTKKVIIDGPLVPDVCFQESIRKKYSFYIASYHDQGLIPFKMVHGTHSGVQYSLGLPFVRTSVDHGTAKDIFGKNKADSRSMENAIKIAIKLIKDKPITW